MNPIEEQLSLEEQLKIEAAKKSFYIFYRDIYSISMMKIEGKFLLGEIFKKRCDDIQRHRRKVETASRKLLKSTLRHAKVMWYLFKLDDEEKFYRSGLYFSATKKMAAKHTKKINRYISVNPYFSTFKKTTDSESIVSYATPRGKSLNYDPAGITEFSRGDTVDDVILDDVLRDDETEELVPTQRVNRIFEEVIIGLVKVDGEIDVVGTLQDEDDLLKRLEKNKDFHSSSYPIWKDELRTISQWPENFTVDHIKFLENSMRKNAFDQEFMCIPARSADGYFISEEIEPLVNKELKPYSHKESYAFNGVLKGGFDIGKKRHPSHLVVFEEINGKKKERLSYYMEGWDYIRQIDFLKKIISLWGIKTLVYDNTRSEFESFFEAGDLPSQMVPMGFTSKTKMAMATEFEKHVMNQDIELLPDERQTRQILGVDNRLQSIETMDGHGEAFWSIAMAMEGFDQSFIEVSAPAFDEERLRVLMAQARDPIRKGCLKLTIKFDDEEHFELLPSTSPTLGIYENPKEDCEYRMGVCLSDEVEGAVVGVVKECRTGNQVAIFYSRKSMDQVAIELDWVGRFYNKASIAINNQGSALTLLNIIEKELFYPDLYYDVSVRDRNDAQTQKLGFTLSDEGRLRLVNLQRNYLQKQSVRLVNKSVIAAHASLKISREGKTSGRFQEYVWADALATYLVHTLPANLMRFEDYQFDEGEFNEMTGY